MQTPPEISKELTKIKKRRLTLKQKMFVNEYVKRKGNGQQAAMAVYDTSKLEVANAIAVENLQKPLVKEEIKAVLNSQGLSLPELTKKLNVAVDSGLGVEAKNSDSIRAIEMLLRLHNAFPATKSINATVDITEAYKAMTHQDLIKELDKSRQETTRLLDDLGG